ncbi:MAG: ABC transporter substrate-binding protein, partial [Planctomycetaceae bacterium]|nr:ABC transporter substrate-binding protein [Planctomycetaceae bacterium]
MNSQVSRRALVALTLFCISVILGCQNNGNNSSTGNGTAADRSPIHVGVIADSTGFMTPHGQGNEMGARIAAEHLNASGGILGHPVELHILDGASDPSTTAERTRELIQRHSISLLIGTTSSATTLAAIPPVTEAKVPFIYSLDGECKTCSPGASDTVSPYVWGSGFTERMVVEPLLTYMHARSGKPANEFSVYFMGGDYVYPRTTNGFAKEVATSLGFTVVGDTYSDTSTQDYSPDIRKIIDASPDLLIVTNPGESGVRFMKQAQTFGLSDSVMISGFATFDQEMIIQMGQASEGVYCINRYSKSLDNPENARFLRSYEDMYPDEKLLPGPTAAAGTYGSLMVAAQAILREHLPELRVR